MLSPLQQHQAVAPETQSCTRCSQKTAMDLRTSAPQDYTQSKPHAILTPTKQQSQSQLLATTPRRLVFFGDGDCSDTSSNPDDSFCRQVPF
jgi:hypothetical protein